MKTHELTDFLDHYLNITAIEDRSLNGLQVDNSGEVSKVACAVDASLAAFRAAADCGAELLLVHHGLFWGEPLPLVGPFYERIRLLLESDLALYAAHLPLDLHPEVGNNACIQEALGWPAAGEFGDYHGTVIGRLVEFPAGKSLDEITDIVRERLGSTPLVWNFGPKTIIKAGYVSGGAVSLLHQAIAAGLDLMITGEPSHSSYWEAKEAGINVIFAGHYATETLGVKALARLLKKKFEIETEFIDLPTGL